MICQDMPELSVYAMPYSQYDSQNLSGFCVLSGEGGRSCRGDMDASAVLEALSSSPNLRAALTRQMFHSHLSNAISYPIKYGLSAGYKAPCDGILCFYFRCSTSAHYGRLYGDTIEQYNRANASAMSVPTITAYVTKGNWFYTVYSVNALCSLTLIPTLGSY